MIDIWQATRADAATVAALNAHVQRLHAEAYPWMFKHPNAGSLSDDDAWALMAKPGFVTFIAAIDGEPAGYTIAEERRRPETGRHYPRDMMLIHEISVRDDARRRGVGRALIAAVQTHGRSLGIEMLTLETWTFNSDAHAFFASCGLKPYRMMMWNRAD